MFSTLIFMYFNFRHDCVVRADLLALNLQANLVSAQASLSSPGQPDTSLLLLDDLLTLSIKPASAHPANQTLLSYF